MEVFPNNELLIEDREHFLHLYGGVSEAVFWDDC